MITKGLTYRFTLTRGAFTLKNDTEKVVDCLFFFMAFDFVKRVYLPDYTPNLAWLIQKPASYFIIYRGLILGQLKRKLKTYVPEMTVESMNIATKRETKEYSVMINYRTNKQEEVKIVFAKFI